jgi:hypothetical protein
VFAPDINQNSSQAIQAMLLVIHKPFRPIAKGELIKQDYCLSLGKLQEEGFLSEDPKYFGK